MIVYEYVCGSLWICMCVMLNFCVETCDNSDNGGKRSNCRNFKHYNIYSGKTSDREVNGAWDVPSQLWLRITSFTRELSLLLYEHETPYTNYIKQIIY